jgi:hypothetical protein
VSWQGEEMRKLLEQVNDEAPSPPVALLSEIHSLLSDVVGVWFG